MDFFASAANIHWKTPSEIIDPARKLFGGVIDLDPCASDSSSNQFAVENWRLPKQNALRDAWGWEWSGEDGRVRRTVFLNPPFGASYVRTTDLGNLPVCLSAEEMKKLREDDAINAVNYVKQTTLDFAVKFTSECTLTCEGVWISKAAVETAAIQHLLTLADAMCIPDHRINYIKPATGQKGTTGATFPSILFYVGPRADKFHQAFAHLGRTVQLRQPAAYIPHFTFAHQIGRDGV